MIIALSIGIVYRTRTTAPAVQSGFTNFWPSYIIPLVIVSLFVGILYFFILRGKPIITEAYFLDNYKPRMLLYGIAGYLATIICFGSFLFLANKLELLNDNRQTSSTPEALYIEAKSYETLKSSFDFTFLLTAAILSAFVLWAGLLFNAVNSIDAMRAYSFYSGRPFLNYDFVYLIGLMHTLLLMVFYIPVKLQFNALEITKEQKALERNELGGKKYLKSVWESLSAILVTTSPLITTILQKFISNLFTG